MSGGDETTPGADPGDDAARDDAAVDRDQAAAPEGEAAGATAAGATGVGDGAVAVADRAVADPDPADASAPAPTPGALRRLRDRLPAPLQRPWIWAPATVIMTLTVVTLVLAWVAKSPCLQTYRDQNHVLQLDWSNAKQYRDACYTDVVPLYTAERLDQPGAFPYKVSWIDGQGTPSAQVRYMEYPVLTGLLMWVSAKTAQHYISFANSTGVLPTTMTVVVFFDVLALFAAVFWLFTVWCIRQMSKRRVWDAAIAAVSPLVIMQAFGNFDMMAVAFATGGMFAWSRQRTVLAGVFIGLGTAAKLYPVLLLIPLLALCLRAGKVNDWLTTASLAGIGWAVVNAPIAFAFPHGWVEFLRLNSTRGADPDSLYNVVTQFTGWGGFDGPLPPHQAPKELNAFIALVLGLGVLAIVLIALTAPRRPRFAQLAFLIVSVFLITNKVWSPQYSLWLIPLAVLAVPRWKLLLGWMLIDAWLWIPRMYFYLGTQQGGWSQNPFLWTVVARDLSVAGLCALVVYEIYHPDRDLVRRSGDDDPTGGVLDGAPDVFLLGRRRRRAIAVAPTPGTPAPVALRALPAHAG